jgi:hypothetical protein
MLSFLCFIAGIYLLAIGEDAVASMLFVAAVLWGLYSLTKRL